MAKKQKFVVPRVKLGNPRIRGEVSKLGFGCMELSGLYNAPVSEEFGISIIKEAFIRGITFLDSADVDNIEALRIKPTKEEFKEISDAVPASEVAGVGSNNFKATFKFASTPLAENDQTATYV